MGPLKLWNYLIKRCKRLNDNNYTARLIYDYVISEHRTQKEVFERYLINYADKIWVEDEGGAEKQKELIWQLIG